MEKMVVWHTRPLFTTGFWDTSQVVIVSRLFFLKQINVVSSTPEVGTFFSQSVVSLGQHGGPCRASRGQFPLDDVQINSAKKLLGYHFFPYEANCFLSIVAFQNLNCNLFLICSHEIQGDTSPPPTSFSVCFWEFPSLTGSVASNLVTPNNHDGNKVIFQHP